MSMFIDNIFSTSKPICPSPPKRKCPLPGLSWADPTDVWRSMCECDAKSSMKKNPNMFDHHPKLQPRMRSILLDWLNEVRIAKTFLAFIYKIISLTCNIS